MLWRGFAAPCWAGRVERDWLGIYRPWIRYKRSAKNADRYYQETGDPILPDSTCLLLALMALVALMVSTRVAAQRYSFREYGSTEGLNNTSVNCLMQDRTGYLWVGTDNGCFVMTEKTSWNSSCRGAAEF